MKKLSDEIVTQSNITIMATISNATVTVPMRGGDSA